MVQDDVTRPMQFIKSGYSILEQKSLSSRESNHLKFIEFKQRQ